ncbi:MAG: FAD-dependent oxidoreductase [Bryobacteraceae bacterium]
MDLTSDFPFWTVRSGLIAAYPPLESDRRCDVLVVGGGITGALLAHELEARGIDCIIVDRRDIGHGSTSASTALLQYEIDTPLDELVTKVGRRHAERAYQLGVEVIHKLEAIAGGDAGFRRRPSLKLAQRPSHIRRLHAEYLARRRAGLAVRWLDRDCLRTEYGISRDAGIRSAVAAEMDPYQMTHRLLLRLKGRVFDRTEATRYEVSRSGITVQMDRGSKIRAKAVFLATGYETNRVLPASIVKLHSTYALMSEPLEDISFWRGRSLIWETGNPYLYARTTSDNRILIGGEDDEVVEGHRRDRQISQKTKRLLKGFARLFPAKPIEPAFSWAGSFGSTPDGLPYIGPYPGMARRYFALGFGGNGITFSAMAATILADLFVGKANADAKIFSFLR